MAALLTLLATVLALLATPAAGAEGAPNAAPTTSARALPINLKLGKIQVGATLPLTLDGLLGRGTPATPPVSSAPPADPPTTGTPYPPTLPSPTSTPIRSSTAPSGGGGASSAAVRGRARPVHVSPATSTHPTPTQQPTTSGSSTPTKKRPPGLVFVQHAVPSSGAALFILLCVACAIGVAFVVKLSGGRRRL